MPAGRFPGGQLNPLNQFNPYNMTTSSARLLNPLWVLRRNALLRGFFAGNKSWMIVGAVLWTPILVRKALGRHSEHVAFDRLAIGHVLRIEVLPQDTKVQRKAYRRTR
jgi:hypothetical protein